MTTTLESAGYATADATDADKDVVNVPISKTIAHYSVGVDMNLVNTLARDLGANRATDAVGDPGLWQLARRGDGARHARHRHGRQAAHPGARRRRPTPSATQTTTTTTTA